MFEGTESIPSTISNKSNKFSDLILYVVFCRVISISSCAQSHPSSIAQRYIQRQVLMSDPNWNNGFYYDGPFPSLGMKNAR